MEKCTGRWYELSKESREVSWYNLEADGKAYKVIGPTQDIWQGSDAATTVSEE